MNSKREAVPVAFSRRDKQGLILEIHNESVLTGRGTRGGSAALRLRKSLYHLGWDWSSFHLFWIGSGSNGPDASLECLDSKFLALVDLVLNLETAYAEFCHTGFNHRSFAIV